MKVFKRFKSKKRNGARPAAPVPSTPNAQPSNAIPLLPATSSLDSEAPTQPALTTSNISQSDSQNVTQLEQTPTSPATLASSAARAGLGLVTSAADAFPPLKSVVGALTYIMTHHDKWLKNKEDVKRIVERVKNLQGIHFKEEAGLMENPYRQQLLRKFKSISDTLEAMNAKNGMHAYITAQDDAGTLYGLLEEVRDECMIYMTAMQKETLLGVEKLMTAADNLILRTLPRAEDANHLAEKHGTCLKGTRLDILHTLDSWANDSSALSVYWLNGHAGSGKSTIAQSFCRQAFADGLLGASFFCSRDYTARSDLHMIFPTLAFQLACRFPEIRKHIVETLKSRPDAGRESLQNQLTSLLIEPLIAAKLTTVIVIDALDECKDVDAEPASTILSLLARRFSLIPTVKWFITGRPEAPIRSGFRLPALRPITEIFVLHDMESSSVDEDIEAFLRTRLSTAKDRSDWDLPTLWPLDKDIHILTKTSGQLFVFAATAVKYILYESGDPAERLAELNRLPENTAWEGGFGIDVLYQTILESGYERARDSELAQLRVALGSIVLAMNPLSTEELALLLPDIKVSTILRQLHSILRIPNERSHPITIYHKSFADYISDRSRCRNTNFFVDPAVHHRALAEGCLRLMNTRLKKNICSLPSYTMNNNRDLQERRKCIGGALEYACLFWADHLSKAQILPSHNWSLLEDFLTQRQIFWFEALSLVENLQAAISSLNQVYNLLESFAGKHDGGATDLLQWTADGRKFILEFRECIELSALHIYHSALPLAPRNSLLRTLHSHDLKAEVKVLHGNVDEWPSALLTVHLQNEFRFPANIQFSNDGRMLGIAGTHSIQILDVATGQAIQELHSNNSLKVVHQNGPPSISFSPDDSLLISAWNAFDPLIWDLKTGALVNRLCNFSSESLGTPHGTQLSPNGRLIAVREYQGISIYDFSTGVLECFLKPEGFYDGFLILDFAWLEEDPLRLVVLKCESFSDTSIASRSIVAIWGVSGGRMAVDVLLQAPVECMAVSTKHGLIACDQGGNLALFQVQRKSLQQISTTQVSQHEWDQPCPLVFSPLEPLLFCAHRFYDISNPLLLTPLTPPLTGIRGVTFSPIQHILATVSGTSLVQIWSSICSDLIVRDETTERRSKLFIAPNARRIISFGAWAEASLQLHIDDHSRITPLPVSHEGARTAYFRSDFAFSENNSSCLYLASDHEKKLAPKHRPILRELSLSSPQAFPSMMPLRLRKIQSDTCDYLRYIDRRGDFAVLVTMGDPMSMVGQSMPDGDVACIRFLNTASGEWAIVSKPLTQWQPFTHGPYDKEWVDMDVSKSVLMIHNTHGVGGAWKIILSCSDNGESSCFMLATDEDASGAQKKLEMRIQEPIPHPIIRSRKNWIINHKGQCILWLDHKGRASLQAFPHMTVEKTWRWSQRRLIVAGDGATGTPFIFDFSGVNVAIPSAADTYREMGYGTIIISGLDRVEKDWKAAEHRWAWDQKEDEEEEEKDEDILLGGSSTRTNPPHIIVTY